MENVLILSYYYPPCGGVASFRPLSWANDFHKHGYYPTIITRHWNGNENKWEDYLKESTVDVKIVASENSKTIYLPYKKNIYLKFAEKKWAQILRLDKLIYLFLAVTGKIHPEVDAYNCFKNYLFAHLTIEKYKLIIVTSPPVNIIRLAVEANKKFNIPFIVDFRDSWNNFILGDNYHPTIKERIYNALKQFYISAWLKKSLFIVTVTPSISHLIKAFSKKPIEIITNGFEENAYISKDTKASDTLFNVSVIGTIHPIQDITIMIEGLNLFIQNKDPEKVRLNFIGLDSALKMSQLVKNSLPEKFLHISPRVSKAEAIERTLASSVLLFPSYKGFKDYYTAKIFEYLGSERNIIMVPGNGDLVDTLILKTQAGKIANSGKEFAKILENWYVEWKNTGTIKYHGIKENINFFSRENQTKIFCKVIKKHIN